MPAYIRDLIFKLLAKFTSPLQGYRAFLGVVGALGLLVYAVMARNFELAGVALTVLMTLAGLEPPPEVVVPPVEEQFPHEYPDDPDNPILRFHEHEPR